MNDLNDLETVNMEVSSSWMVGRGVLYAEVQLKFQEYSASRCGYGANSASCLNEWPILKFVVNQKKFVPF